MNKVIVTTTAGVRSFGSTYFDFAVSLWYSKYVARLADTNHLRLVWRISITKFMQHFNRVRLNHTVEHILDFVGTSTLMGNDERVETNFMNKLEPCHVYLNSG